MSTTPTPRVRIAVPSEGPLITAIIICPTCGQGVLPTLTRIANGRINSITFYHSNEDFGCAWKNSDPMRRTSGETTGLVANVRMGGDSKGNPIIVNEFDLAKGTSFDLDGLKPEPEAPRMWRDPAVPSLQKAGGPPATLPVGDRKFVVPTKQGGQTADLKPQVPPLPDTEKQPVSAEQSEQGVATDPDADNLPPAVE